jgi:hypothetical protein
MGATMPRYAAILYLIIASILVATLALSPMSKAEVQCIPDLKTIQLVIEDIQRIRVSGEQSETLLRDIRDSLKKRK